MAPTLEEADARRIRELPEVELLGRVGCLACSGPELFGRIVAVAAGQGDSFAVVTEEAPFARVWNREDGTSSQFGKKGQGPGELLRPVGVVMAGAMIYVAATSGGRHHIEAFASDGNHLQSRSITLAPLGTWDVFVGSPSGDWAALRQGLHAKGRVLRMDLSSGDVTDVIRPPWLLDGVTVSENVAAAHVSVAVADDGTIALGYGLLDYKLALVPPHGGAPILGGRALPREELPALSGEELEQQRREAVAALERVNPPPPPSLYESMLRRARTFTPPSGPRYRPHFLDVFGGALRFDAAGRLWVRTIRGAEETVFDLFDRNLAYLGEVRIEEPLVNWHIGTNTLIGSVLDDLGVPFVKIWSLR